MSAADNPGSEPQPPVQKGLFDIQAKAPPASGGFDFQAKAPILPPAAVREHIGKPAAAPRGAEQFSLLTARWDAVLAGLALVLVVFLAAFPIWNSDLWMHLATGRLIAQGEYDLGSDPFSVASEGTWVNHAWLYDWMIYVLYELLGGPSLVVLKVIATAALGVVLFRAATPKHGTQVTSFLPVVFVALSMLVLSSRLFLQPTLFSMLFLGITLWLVLEPDAQSEGVRKRLWFVVPLFALWVNMDGWFVLGPMVVLLVLLSSAIQHWMGNPVPPGRLTTLALVLVAGTAACVLNPHHIHAFVLPPELAYLTVQIGDFSSSFVAPGTGLSEMAQVEPQLLWSPFASDHFFRIGHNVAGKAYFGLFLACIGSFSLLAYLRRLEGLRAFPWARALLCVVFGLLSALLARLVPFFAVVAGPITALNFCDCLAAAYRDATPTRSRQNLLLTARGVVGIAFGLLLFLAWPGWLHSYFGDPVAIHRVGFSVEPEPSYVAAAGFLKDNAGDGNVFNTASDFSNYLAWYGGKVKGFTDYRFGLFAKAAATHVRVRNSLRDEALKQLTGDPGKDVPAAKDKGEPAWRKVFKDAGITRISLHNYQRDNLTRTLVGWMLLRHDQWTLLYGDGRTIIFGLEEPGKPRRYPDTREMLSREAFGERRDTASEKPVPWTPPGGFWSDYAVGRPRSSLATSKAGFHFDHFQLVVQQWQGPYVQSWRAASWNQVPAIASAAPACVTGPATLLAFLYLPGRVFNQPYGADQRPFLRAVDSGVPALPVLVVREALQAVRENPKDAQALRLLGDGYSLLWQAQEDYWSYYTGMGGPFLRQELRRMQVLGGLQRALALDPGNPDLHWALAQKYDQLFLLDAAREHVLLACQSLHLVSRKPFETEKELDERKQSMVLALKSIDKELTARRDDFKLRTARGNLFQKYRVAMEEPYKSLEKTKEFVDERGRGLALTGLGLLDQLIGDSAKLGQLSETEQSEVAHALVRLNLLLGRWQEAKQLLGNLERSPLYHNLHALLAAASSDYDSLEKAIAEMDKSVPVDVIRQVFAARASGLPAALCLDNLPHARIGSFYQARLIGLAAQQDYYTTLVGAAPIRTLRGLFALEQGDTARARDYFKQALEMAGPQINFVDRRIAERYLDLMGKN